MIVNYGVIYHETTDCTGSEREAAAEIYRSTLEQWMNEMEQRMEVYNNEIVEIDIKESVFILVHKLWLMVIIGILFAICTGLVNIYLVAPVYRSTSRVYITNQQKDDELSLAESGTGDQLTDEEIALAKSKAINQVILNFKLDLSPEELIRKVTVNQAEGTCILEINVVDENPVMAKKMVDMIAKLLTEQMVVGLEPEGSALIEEGNLPAAPFCPNLCKKVLLGAGCGILFSIVVLALGHLPGGQAKKMECIEQYSGTAHRLPDLLRVKLAEVKKVRREGRTEQ